MIVHDQTRFPLATLVLVACERSSGQRARLLALAARVSHERASVGIPPIGE